MLTLLKPFRFLHRVEIEAKANSILEQMQETSLYTPQFPLDTSRVAEFLGLDVVWDSIAPDEDGEIAARLLPLEGLIEINEAIPNMQGGFGESTIAHEIGHWVLHIDWEAIQRYCLMLQKGVMLQVKPLLCRNEAYLRGIEWQAQYFASCLLMPQDRLRSHSFKYNLTDWQHLYAMAEAFGVTISHLVYRLKDLGWIHIPNGTREIYLYDVKAIELCSPQKAVATS